MDTGEDLRGAGRPSPPTADRSLRATVVRAAGTEVLGGPCDSLRDRRMRRGVATVANSANG